MKRTIFFIAAVSCFLTSAAQNLVSNGDLENFTMLPTSYGQINNCTGWNNCMGNGDADYYNTGGTSLPAFGPIAPYSGNCMAGLSTYHSTIPGFREYMSTQLTQPLSPGMVYKISFFLTSGVNGIYSEATDHFGAALTQSQLIQSGNQHIIVAGQPELTDTVCSSTWQQYNLYYSATGGEQYLTLGNFRDDVATSHVFCHTGSINAAYYFIDDISVELYITAISENLPTERFSVYPSPFVSEITIQFPDRNTFVVSLSNYLGDEVYSGVFSEQSQAELDLSFLTKGIYFLSLRSKERKYVTKIIKM